MTPRVQPCAWSACTRQTEYRDGRSPRRRDIAGLRWTRRTLWRKGEGPPNGPGSRGRKNVSTSHRPAKTPYSPYSLRRAGEATRTCFAPGRPSSDDGGARAHFHRGPGRTRHCQTHYNIIMHFVLCNNIIITCAYDRYNNVIITIMTQYIRFCQTNGRTTVIEW